MSEIRLGMIGYNEGNGHPFSFSSIINGYDAAPLRQFGWDRIADYLEQQDPNDIGISGARVTSIWTPQIEISEAVAATAGIKAILAPDEMLENVDAVVIARDDWESHHALAMPFLKAGKSVFIDKPLTLDRNELNDFEPYLRSGKLMSCSALRYAGELDELRARPQMIGELQCVTGAVVLRFHKYGVHLLEAVCSIVGECPTLIFSEEASRKDLAVFKSSKDVLISLNALGETAAGFRLSFFGDKGTVEVNIRDNFTAFRRCMLHFLGQVRSGEPAIDPKITLDIMSNLMKIKSRV